MVQDLVEFGLLTQKKTGLICESPELLLLLNNNGKLTITVSPDLPATAVDAYGCLAEVVVGLPKYL